MDDAAGQIDVTFVVYDGIQGLDLVGPWEVFHGANCVLDSLESKGPRYRLGLVSTDGRSIATESGLSIATSSAGDWRRAVHTVVVPGGFGARAATADRRLLEIVNGLAAGAERIVTVCSGTFVAAAAGLADGKRAPTRLPRRRRRPGPDLLPRRPAVVIGGRDGRDRSGAGDRRRRPLGRDRPVRRPLARDVPAAAGWPVTVRDTDLDRARRAGAGA